MPLKWVYPEVAFRHKGVTIFHTYRNDDAGDVSDNWYTTDQSTLEDSSFDVRDLKRSLKDKLHTNCNRDDIFRAGIEAGLIKSPEGVDYYSKHIIVHYTFTKGEHCFTARPAILDMHPDADVEEIIHLHFEDFFGDGTYKNGNSYFDALGEVAITINRWEEISLNDVEIMESHGTQVWGRRTFNESGDAF